VTKRATGRTLQRYFESARPASSATLSSYTTSRDATPDQWWRQVRTWPGHTFSIGDCTAREAASRPEPAANWSKTDRDARSASSRRSKRKSTKQKNDVTNVIP